MQVSHYQHVECTLTCLERVQLGKPLIAQDFIAGFDLAIMQWRVIPLVQVSQFELNRLQPGQSIQKREETLAQHVAKLVGQSVIIASATQTRISGTLLELEAGLLWVQVNRNPLAIPLSNLLSIWLWKTQTTDLADVPALR